MAAANAPGYGHEGRARWRRLARTVPSNDTQRHRIRALAGAGRSTAQIWARMMDDHDMPLTYSAINAFLRAGRSATRR